MDHMQRAVLLSGIINVRCTASMQSEYPRVTHIGFLKSISLSCD